MALSTLPIELKLSAIQYLDPESTFHFALTCKDHATICQSILKEHGRLLLEGQVFDTDWGNVLLWRFLLEVFEDPSIGWYVRELNLPPNRQTSWVEEHQSVQNAPSEEEKTLFDNAARQLQDLYTPTTRFSSLSYHPLEGLTDPNDMIGTIQARISKGYEDGIIAILLHHLPFLQTIRITDSDTVGLEIFVRRIADEYQKPDRSPHLPFRHLKTVAIAHRDSEMSCAVDWAVSFRDIPSLTTLVAQCMGNSSYFVKPDTFSVGHVPTSNVTELFLYSCQLDAEKGLAVILADIKNLKKFTYTSGGCTVSDSSYYNPKMVIRELVKYAAHSLEELTMDQSDLGEDLSDEMDIPTTSLRAFQKLRILNIEYKLLRPLDRSSSASSTGTLKEGFYTADAHAAIDDVWDVRIILPESLEEFYSHGEFDGDDGAYDEWEQVKDLFGTESAMVPRLKMEKVCIRRRRMGYSEDVIGMAETPAAIWESPVVKRLLEGHGY